MAPDTFSRLVKQFEMLRLDQDCEHKHRLAFTKAHANEMWQADTLYGSHVTHDGAKLQPRLIAFVDDASRVCCHGQFFCAENVDTLIEARDDRLVRVQPGRSPRPCSAQPASAHRADRTGRRPV